MHFFFFFFFFENLPRDVTPSYRPMVPIPVHKIHPVKGHNFKSYGPFATILPLHLPYLRDQVWYKVHLSRNTKVIKQNEVF